MKKVLKEEQAFDKKLNQFEQENNKVAIENDHLQEELDKYCIEKENFEREAEAIKDKGLRDKSESEEIGHFKTHKEALYEKLKKRREDIEKQKSMIQEDRVKLNIFRNELMTKQKTIETLRYNYIKSDQ